MMFTDFISKADGGLVIFRFDGHLQIFPQAEKPNLLAHALGDVLRHSAIMSLGPALRVLDQVFQNFPKSQVVIGAAELASSPKFRPSQVALRAAEVVVLLGLLLIADQIVNHGGNGSLSGDGNSLTLGTFTAQMFDDLLAIDDLGEMDGRLSST